MKIVMICDFFNESLTYQENQLAKYYIAAGHEVTIVTSTTESLFDYNNDIYDPTLPSRSFEAAGAKIIRLPYRLNFLNRVRMFGALDSLLEAEAPDVVFVHNINPNLLPAVRYKRKHAGSRLVVDSHADYSNSGKNWVSLKILHGLIRKYFLKVALPHLDHIFAVTPSTLLFLNETYGLSLERMELLPLGADLESTSEVERAGSGQLLRQSYGIADNDIVLLSGGRLSPAKRTDLLIEAFKSLSAPNAWLFVVGESAEADAEYFESLRMSASGHRRIVFTGWLAPRPMLEHLSMADIAVFPACQSVVWQQSIGLGKPLVLGEPRARLNGEQDVAYLNAYGNIAVTDEAETSARWLAETIDGLLADPARRRRMAEGARRVAAELLDWSKIADRTLSIRQGP